MANIGTFKPTKGGGYEGIIATLTAKRDVTFEPNKDQKSENSPDYFVKTDGCDIGVAWNKTSKVAKGEKAKPYIKVLLDGPEMPRPVNAVMFDRKGGADLVWSRPKSKKTN